MAFFYPRRINVQIPHNLRVCLDILAKNTGMKVSVYARGILQNYLQGYGPGRYRVNGAFADRNAWHKCSAALHQDGPDSVLHIRVTEKMYQAMNVQGMFSRSDLIRAMISTHIIANTPKLPAEIIAKQCNDIRKIARECRQITDSLIHSTNN